MEGKLSDKQQDDLLQLVEGMEDALMSEEDAERSAAANRIVQALKQHHTHYSGSSINHIAAFFAEKLRDRACLSGALRAFEILLCKPQGDTRQGPERDSQAELLDRSIVEKVERAIAIDLPVPTLSHENRRLCLSLLRGIVEQEYGRQLLQMDVPLLGHVMEVVDSERDPRCLLVAFGLLRAVINLYRTSDNASRTHLEAKSEDVCDVVSCYFPITFRAPPNSEHGVTRERLAAELEATMACTPVFAAHLIPLLLDKLSSSIPQAKLDALSALKACVDAWGSGPFNSFMGRIWWLLREETSSCSLPDEQASSAATACLRTFMRAEQESNRGDADEGSRSLLRQVLEDEMVLDLPQWLAECSAGGESASLTKRFSGINPLLTAVAGATPEACLALMRRILNPLCSHINAGQPEAEVLALSCLLALFRGAAEGCASWPRGGEAELAVREDLSKGGSQLIQQLLAPPSVPGGDHCLPLSGGLKGGLLRVRLLGQLVSFEEGRAQPLSPEQHEAVAAALLQVVRQRGSRPELAHEAAQGLVSMAGANHVAVFQRGILPGLVEAACVGSRATAGDGASASVLTPELRCLVDTSRLSPSLRTSILSSMTDVRRCRTPHCLTAAKRTLAASAWQLSAARAAVMQASLALLARLSAERGAPTAAAATTQLNALAGEVLPACTSPSGFEGEEAAAATRLALGLLDASDSLRAAVEPDVVVAVASAAQSATAGCAAREQQVIALRAAQRVVGWQAPLSAVDQKEAALTVACASLIALRPATVLDESRVDHIDLLRSTMGAALLSLSKLSAEVAAAATASLLLKWQSSVQLRGEHHGRTSLDAAIAVALDDVIFPRLQLHVQEDGAASRVRATRLLGWVGKALAMIKHPALSKPIETATAALEVASLDMAAGEREGWREQEACETSDAEVGAGEGNTESASFNDAVDVEEARAMARLFANLLQQGEGLARLDKSVHAAGKILWQQRVFTEAMASLDQKLLEGLGYLGLPPTPLLLAVAHLSGACAPEILRTALETVLLWLLPALQALTMGPLAEGQALRAALQGVRAALDCEPGRSLLEDRVGQVASGLLADAAFGEDEAVRMEALHCLSLLAQLPYIKLHPHRGDVLAALDKAVDDPKRAVRSQAAAAKRAWEQQR